MVHKILFWSGFGIAVRFWQLGIEMRPFFNYNGLWAYPFFAGVGGSFGYWLTGVQDRQDRLLQERKHSLLEKRRRRAEREEKAEGEALHRSPEEVGQGHGVAGGEGRDFLMGRR